MANIVWLASYPKSGNTWLRAFIYNLLINPPKPATLAEITGFFESESNPKYYRRFITKPLDEATFDELIALRPKVQQDIVESQAQGSVMLKTHNQLTVLQGTALHNLSLTAAALYVVRNPLDVVLSLADHFAVPIDEAIEFLNNPNTGTGTDAESVGGFLGSWSHHVESWTHSEHERFLVIRYEDMLDKPMPTFTRVANQLGLQPDKALLKRSIDASSFKKLQQSEAETGFSEKSVHSKQFFRHGHKNQWIEKLSDAQISAVVDANYEQMSKFGYVPPKFRKRS